ncbi:MAG: hypothetical protein KC413_23280 [Anaerolineales bacterium]|nr:hypothetical protein [Anaerolineales bacterium]MCA9978709.1 hypothetical protein [Anaerolineales bacterium]MCB8967216.1 hypothetical protein [Ardenticatenaceae bacterium]
MARESDTQTAQRPGMGALGLALAGITLAGIGYLLKDAIGIAYRSIGAIIWVIALLIAFMFGLLYYSQFILSLRGSEGWSGGLSLLWRHYGREAERYMNQLTQPKPKRRRRVKIDEPIIDPDALPASFREVGAGMVRSHQALSLGRGDAFQRAAGPGFVLLYHKENIKRVIDLRPHVRRHPVKTTTRDGIPVETAVSVTFRVRHNAAIDDALPYPFDRDAIFQVSYANTIDKERRTLPWTEQLAPRAAALLVLELNRFTLDDLYQVDDIHALPMDEIKRNIQRQLERPANTQGLEVLNVGIDHLLLPPDVVTQRIKTWQSRWEREIQVRQAAGDAEAERRIKKARARVQVEIIESIMQSIATMRRTDKIELADIVMLRMIEALEEAMSDTSVRAIIPEQIVANWVLDASNQMRAWIAPPQDDKDA